jgi:hypothetical protein
VGPTGPAGEVGPQGEQGEQGEVGPSGPVFSGGTVEQLIVTGAGTSLDVTAGNIHAFGELLSSSGSVRNDLNGSLAMRSNFDVLFARDEDDTDPGAWFQWFDNGENLALFGSDIMRLDHSGDLLVAGTVVPNGLDLAESYPTVDPSLGPGMVVAVDPDRSQHVLRAGLAGGTQVLGIVSTQPGVALSDEQAMHGRHPELLMASRQAVLDGNPSLGRSLRQQWIESESIRTDRVYVALAGRVPVLIDPQTAAIRAGDALGLGSLAGTAARHPGYGPVLGVALEDWTGLATLVAFVQLEIGQGAPAPVTGEGVIPTGISSLVVQAEGLTPESLLGISFHGDPGSRHWISHRGHGYFVLELAAAAVRSTPFGFFELR